MNQFTAPCGTDMAHHRNHFPPAIRAALGLLDRAAEGQDVSDRDVELALSVTGDFGTTATRTDTARARAFAEGAGA